MSAKISWSKSNRRGKKYKAVVTFPSGEKKTVHFGSSEHEHYKDTTPLKLYSHLDHLDEKRRENYRKRHGAQGFQKKKYSPAWFSWNYLW